jgi:hypothetical protein
MLVFSTGKETKPLFYRSRTRQRKKDKEKMTRYSHVRKKHKSDCRIMTAEPFSGIEEMAPRDDTGFGRRQSSDNEMTSARSIRTMTR